jgi:antitoxin YefM
VLAAVHHAEVVALRMGEPFGSLVLAVTVTVIEVALIVTPDDLGWAGRGVAGVVRDVRVHPDGASPGLLPPGHAARCPAPQPSRAYNFLYVKEGKPMKTMTYSESRARYAEVLDSVVDDREEIVITRAGREPVVIVSLEDYQSLKETAYLLRSPENARRLLASIERLESGQGIPRDLAE